MPHHLIDVVEPDAGFSAADYARLARAAIAAIRARGRLPIVAGGTGLYLRALLQGLFEGPARDEALRPRLERIATRFGDARLHRLLQRFDPTAAARTHARDRVRVVRALEVYLLTGRAITAQQQQQGGAALEGPQLLIGLCPDRTALRAAVVARTRQMLERGLLAEVLGLLARFGEPPPRPLAGDWIPSSAGRAPGRWSLRRGRAGDRDRDDALRQAPDDLVPTPGPPGGPLVRGSRSRAGICGGVARFRLPAANLTGGSGSVEFVSLRLPSCLS